MNLLAGSLSDELRKLLRQYVEHEGLSLGKLFFSSHVREIERMLVEEIERDVRTGKVRGKRVLKAG